MIKGQADTVALARAVNGRTGNLPPLPGIFHDHAAPIMRNACSGQDWR